MNFRNILVIYDPTRQEQPALERAAAIAGETDANLCVFACIYEDLDKSADKAGDTRQLIARQTECLNQAIVPLTEKGISVTTEVEWDKDWYTAAVRASVRKNADLVLKSSYRHSSRQRILNRTSDWTLIRECLCPVLLVKEGEQRDTRRVLAAVDIRSQKASYQNLNENIIGFSKRLLDGNTAEVHFINAFKDLNAFPDRNELIRNCGVESDRIHIQMGDPDEVIVNGARELDASLVVVGNSARSGLAAAISGNTVEKVLDQLECDVLSMP
jgi:universal stress protein E